MKSIYSLYEQWMYTEIKFIFLMIVIDFESRNIKRNLIFKVLICAFVIL